MTSDRWKVGLEGHQFDLQDLAKWLAGGSVTVTVGTGSFLQADVLDALDDPEEVRQIAHELVRVINGAARVLNPEFRQISVGPGVRRGNFDYVHETVTMRDHAELTVMNADGTVVPDPASEMAQRWVRTAFGDERLRQILDYLSGSAITWSDLYRVTEVLEELRVVSRGDKEIGLLQWTANNFAAIGLDARHAKQNQGDPPAKPMMLPEATAIVLARVRALLESRSIEQKDGDNERAR